MKIVHIAPNAPFNEGWSYQENLLPKYHMKLGHDVTLIITNLSWINGSLVEVDCEDKISKDGFRLIRLKQLSPLGRYTSRFYSYLHVYDYLLELKPDVCFFHGFVSATIHQVVRYKKIVNNNLKIIQDNHLDYNIGKIRKNITGFVNYYINRLNYKITNRYINLVCGVTPWRTEYAIDIYGVPVKKTKTLIMGADDDMIDFKHKFEIRKSVREKYKIPDKSFLIVSGGKIDQEKNIHLLMQAVNEIEDVYLLIFGNVYDDVRNVFNHYIENQSRIKYIGWISGDEIYDYFLSSDLICFPGRHSVLWEQACASKVPCLFKRWQGMEHVNNGGNACFIDHVDEANIKEKIRELKFTDKYYKMKKIAESDNTDIFLYSHIASDSLNFLKDC